MIEIVIAKFLGYGVFWDSGLRNRFRRNLRSWLSRGRRVLWSCTVTALPKAVGERLVEQRISIFGIDLFARRWRRPKYRVGLLVDEFFGGWDTAIGGYGALARKYICRFIPDDALQIDVLLNVQGGSGVGSKVVDQTVLYRLPFEVWDRQSWLEKQAYNLFISIEMTEPSFRILESFTSNVPLLYWIQDPRELNMYQSRLRSMRRVRDDDWNYLNEVSDWIKKLLERNQIFFISQGNSLSAIARQLYNLPSDVRIKDVANPIEIDDEYIFDEARSPNKIVFLGRLEAQKRAWIFCEIAKAMPQFEFFVIGATGVGRNEGGNAKALEAYRNLDGSSKIKNLHFTGHLDGNAKNDYIRSAKILVNTSIWEGIPVSWLEALSYGTLIVSSFDRDFIVTRFGTFVGEIMGDGVDESYINLFVDAINYWMTNDAERKVIGMKAINYVRERHSIENFVDTMRSEIYNVIP